MGRVSSIIGPMCRGSCGWMGCMVAISIYLWIIAVALPVYTMNTVWGVNT